MVIAISLSDICKAREKKLLYKRGYAKALRITGAVLSQQRVDFRAQKTEAMKEHTISGVMTRQVFLSLLDI